MTMQRLQTTPEGIREHQEKQSIRVRIDFQTNPCVT
jgi:hypothetical protein